MIGNTDHIKKNILEAKRRLDLIEIDNCPLLSHKGNKRLTQYTQICNSQKYTYVIKLKHFDNIWLTKPTHILAKVSILTKDNTQELCDGEYNMSKRWIVMLFTNATCQSYHSRMNNALGSGYKVDNKVHCVCCIAIDQYSTPKIPWNYFTPLGNMFYYRNWQIDTQLSCRIQFLPQETFPLFNHLVVFSILLFWQQHEQLMFAILSAAYRINVQVEIDFHLISPD